jgi:hypothetical protein
VLQGPTERPRGEDGLVKMRRLMGTTRLRIQESRSTWTLRSPEADGERAGAGLGLEWGLGGDGERLEGAARGLCVSGTKGWGTEGGKVGDRGRKGWGQREENVLKFER